MANKANQNQAKRMAEQGKSTAQIERKTGVSAQRAENLVSRAAPVIQARQETQQQIANTPQVGQRPGETATVYAPGVTPPAQPTPTPTKPTTLTQGLKIAGTGGITRQDLNTILDTTGKSGEKVIQRLDALNQKLKGKDQVGISLNSGAANMLIKRAQKAPTRKPFMMPMQFGTGQIGKALQGMLGTPGYAGATIKGQMVGGREGIPGTGLMTGGTAIRPGGRPTVRGFGKQFTGMPSSKGPYDGMMDNLDGNDQGLPPPPPTTTSIEPILPEELPEEEQTPQFMSGSSADLANWATGFRRKGSSRKGAGPRAQGLGSQRVNPTGSFRGGM